MFELCNRRVERSKKIKRHFLVFSKGEENSEDRKEDAQTVFKELTKAYHGNNSSDSKTASTAEQRNRQVRECENWGKIT